ncbi:MAG TPA: hypothetical protein VLU46_12835 [Thermoanaerobaculia bacterium]|nr:hypothetical protein [Thermoanaerobaculia bacterium]
MAQFLLITTLLTIAGLLTTMIAGWMASPGHVAQHIMFALTTVVIGLFSQSMTMFFFIGTGKQLKDNVKGTASENLVRQRIRELKSRVFPIATYSTAVLMVTFIMGGGVSTGKTPKWLHAALAFASMVMFARAYWNEIHAMNDNAALMNEHYRDSRSEIRDS